MLRRAVGALLLGLALVSSAIAQDREFVGPMRQEEPRLRSPLAEDIDRQLRTARDIEQELSREQSRVNARSASELQRRQTRRDVELSEQRLQTLKTQSPHAPPIPLLERRLDRVSRPTGAISRDPGLESGAETSLGLSGRVGGR